MGKENTLETMVRSEVGSLFRSNTKEIKKDIAKMRKDGKYTAVSALSILNLAVRRGLVKFADKQDKFFDTEFNYLQEHLQVTPNEAILLAIVFNNEDTKTGMGNIYRAMKMSYLQMRQYDSTFRSLEEKEYLYVDSKFEYIDRNQEAFDSIVECRPYVHIDRSKEPIENVLNDMKRFANCLDKNAFNKMWKAYKQKYRGHKLFERISTMTRCSGADYALDSEEQLMFLFILQYVFDNPSYIGIDTLEGLYDTYIERKNVILNLQSAVENNADYFGSKIGYGLFNNFIEDGMASTGKFILTDKGAEYFDIRNLGMNEGDYDHSYNVRRYETINEKELFYDEDTQIQIDRLFDLLDENNFNGIQERLAESNMRIGFNILLYGSAGTGKTETCLQLSRATHRDLFVVEVSDFKDKYVGESEKRIKGVFRMYNEIVDDCKKNGRLVPIMLLNEADAIIGIRKKGAENAVDKMENSVQNIILNEMENLRGVMIATTNLTENLDSAFERRFIYKVKYNRPDKSAKAKIWKSNIPSLNDDDINRLADEYDFSGGEIENIVRKTTVENILSGREVSYDMISEFSKNEKLSNANSRSKIGFNI